MRLTEWWNPWTDNDHKGNALLEWYDSSKDPNGCTPIVGVNHAYLIVANVPETIDSFVNGCKISLNSLMDIIFWLMTELLSLV